MTRSMMGMGIVRLSASLVLLALNFLILVRPEKRISAYNVIIPGRIATFLTDLVVVIVFHNLMFWFLKQKMEHMSRKLRNGIYDITCKSHLKILWVLVLTCSYTMIDLVY